MIKAISLAIFFVTFANVASTKSTTPPAPSCTSVSRVVCAPEMDRGSAVAGLSILLGGVAVILGRRGGKLKA
jgi:hypothetical protein